MSRQTGGKRPKVDQGLALPSQSSSWSQGASSRGSYTPTGASGLALPSGGTTGYSRQQYSAQSPPQEPVIDPALQQPVAYQSHSSTPLALPQPSQPSQLHQAPPPQSQSAQPQYYPPEYYQQYQAYYQQNPQYAPYAQQQQQPRSAQQGYPQPYQAYQAGQQQPQSQQHQYAQSSQAQSQARRGRPAATPKAIETKETLRNDVLANSGVDLRAEEDAIQRAYDVQPAAYPAPAYSREDRSRKQQFMAPQALMRRMTSIASAHNVTTVSQDAASYVALAAQSHLSTLLKGALTACKNRQANVSGVARPPGLYPSPAVTEGEPEGPPLPMWSQELTRDVGKQITAIERVQRDNELQARSRKHEREEAAANASSTVDGDDQPKKKKKKEGPGVAARNMSEDVRKRLSDQVAMREAGGMSRYSWMTAGATAASQPIIPVKPRQKLDNKPKDTTTPTSKRSSSGWGRAFQRVNEEPKDTRRRVEVRDVIWAMEGRAGSGIPSGGTRGVGRGGKGGTRWRGWEAWGRVRE